MSDYAMIHTAGQGEALDLWPTQEGTDAKPSVTPNPTKRCKLFGRPHHWTIGAFYWPLGGQLDGTATLYVGDDYVMCAVCGQIESEVTS